MVSSTRLNGPVRKKNKQNQVEPVQVPHEAGDLIVSYLEQIGVEYVFGIPGGPIEPLYNALARSARRGGPRPVIARHESGAAFMADGYARETGKLGVCCATTGPGATNMITGVASAYQDNTPLLIITAQTPLPTFGKGAVQESSCLGINTTEILRYCTKFSSFVSHVDQLEWKLASALIAAHQLPMGPAHLSIPLDLLRSPVQISDRHNYDVKNLIRPVPFYDPEANERLLQLVDQSNKAVILIGERCEKAVDMILDLSLLIGAKVIATPQGKGLISPYHPQFRGVYGVAGHTSAISAVTDHNVDLVIAVGTTLDEAATNGWDDNSLMTNKLVHIDSSPRFFSRSPMAQHHVCGDIEAIFQFLYDRVSKSKKTETAAAGANPHPWTGGAKVIKFDRRMKDRRSSERSTAAGSSPKLCDFERRSCERRKQAISNYNMVRHFTFNDEAKCYDDTSPVKPQRLMFDLSRLFPPDTRFVAEIGNSFLWAIHYLQPFNRRVAGTRAKNQNLFFTGMGFSSMGWAIGGSVGVALGRKDSPVVCITGDGSFLMSGQEITVAVQEKLPIVFVLLNDASLGTVRHGQTLAGAESIGHELPQVNYAEMARAMGAEAYTINSPDDMAALDIRRICHHLGPTLLDVHIDKNEAPPLGERLEMLASGK